MRWGLLVAILAGVGAVVALMAAFLTGASPYVTVAEAKAIRGQSLHLAGDIVPGTVVADPRAGIVRFDVVDAKGEKIGIIYEGPPPATMSYATRVVAIGGVRDGSFHSKKLLLKCPSKYESDPSMQKAS